MSPERLLAVPPLAERQPELLVVDDDRMQRMLIAETAKRCGYSVALAASLGEAVEKLSERRFTTLVLDLSLGDHDGVEVIRHLAGTSQRPTVLVISGFDERIRDAAVRLARGVGLGTLGTLHKPLSLGALRQHLIDAATMQPGALGRADSGVAVTADEVAEAIETGAIRPVYQPKVDLRTGRIVGVETLARWESEVHGTVPPDVFVPVAEDAGLAGALTRLMMAVAIRDAGVWRATASDVGVAVNVPPSALDDVAWPDLVEVQLWQASLPPEVLTVEITESTAMSDNALVSDVLTRLRIKGVNLSLDDFGTGYSSLRTLLSLPFSELKLDRSFVQRCDQDAYAWKIVRASLSLAHEFGMRTVAEGVETAAVAALLADADCDVAQGYFFSRPLSLGDLVARLAEGPAGVPGDPLPRVSVA
ncbi:EAL domain-containing response regulator [Alsobacter sp. R-9]